MPALRTLTICAISSILAFFAGIITNDFVDFRSDARKSVQSRLESFDQTAKAVDTALSTFAKISAGERMLSPEELDNLRGSLLDFQRAALDVSYKIPETAEQYQQLESSINTILDRAAAISTPDKNKPFVSAVENFLYLSYEFQDKAKKSQQNYLKGLLNDVRV
ncbi:hypothetical protein [Rhizobium mesosinicum]|uniref:Methyl-accepting chemotaxis protein n=1 Tax=Rhizobium mesosinicum TaxID=335017 RepID=A0ABS7GU54_9HYPH|nr:hypothetical protein [Rhizobium mesosinicum]MBW9053482.1 hypothetical protein [Rhizobium mesosinicum]